MSEQPKIPTPTRHGNWNVIDGVLVDLDTMTLIDGSKYEPESASDKTPASEATEPAKRMKKAKE